MTLTKYFSLSLLTLALLLVCGVDSDTFAQNSENNGTANSKTIKNKNGLTRLEKSPRKKINIRAQLAKPNGSPEIVFATAKSKNTRSNSEIIRPRIVPDIHSQEKAPVIKTDSRNSENMGLGSSDLRMRLVSNSKINKGSKD